MNFFGGYIRLLRKQARLSLSVTAKEIGLDASVLSKIERGIKKASRKQVHAMAEFYSVSADDLIKRWLADDIACDLEGEPLAGDALRSAEMALLYAPQTALNREAVIDIIRHCLASFPQIKRAWLFGSFARQDDGPESDIDIVISTSDDFNYFDLGEAQFRLERSLKRPVDIGFAETIKKEISDHVEHDKLLIYDTEKE